MVTKGYDEEYDWCKALFFLNKNKLRKLYIWIFDSFFSFQTLVTTAWKISRKQKLSVTTQHTQDAAVVKHLFIHCCSSSLHLVLLYSPPGSLSCLGWPPVCLPSFVTRLFLTILTATCTPASCGTVTVLNGVLTEFATRPFVQSWFVFVPGERLCASTQW